jgi:hypothetical protein
MERGNRSVTTFDKLAAFALDTMTVARWRKKLAAGSGGRVYKVDRRIPIIDN